MHGEGYEWYRTAGAAKPTAPDPDRDYYQQEATPADYRRYYQFGLRNAAVDPYRAAYDTAEQASQAGYATAQEMYDAMAGTADQQYVVSRATGVVPLAAQDAGEGAMLMPSDGLGTTLMSAQDRSYLKRRVREVTLVVLALFVFITMLLMMVLYTFSMAGEDITTAEDGFVISTGGSPHSGGSSPSGPSVDYNEEEEDTTPAAGATTPTTGATTPTTGASTSAAGVSVTTAGVSVTTAVSAWSTGMDGMSVHVTAARNHHPVVLPCWLAQHNPNTPLGRDWRRHRRPSCFLCTMW